MSKRGDNTTPATKAHGRLIDLDALLTAIAQHQSKSASDILFEIMLAPIVVEQTN